MRRNRSPAGGVPEDQILAHSTPTVGSVCEGVASELAVAVMNNKQVDLGEIPVDDGRRNTYDEYKNILGRTFVQ